MIYGLYLSATGVMTSSYRQDVIANNLANAETVGFKRDLATFQQRPTADQENPTSFDLNRDMLDRIGGGILALPSQIDSSQGPLEATGKPMDAAILGDGYFTVAGTDGQQYLTRDGRFRVDSSGHLALSNSAGNRVLSSTGQPIAVDPSQPIHIDSDGTVTQVGQTLGQIGMVNVADPSQLQKAGGSLLSYPPGTNLTAATGRIVTGSVEDANVDPAMEMTDLMQTQRELEANANMIHYQDQTMDELVNTVGKVG